MQEMIFTNPLDELKLPTGIGLSRRIQPAWLA